MNPTWCLPLILLIVAPVWCEPNFGIPILLPGSVSVRLHSNLLKTSMNKVDDPIKRLPSNLHSEPLREAADIISKLATGVAEKGKNLASNLYTAATDRTTSETNPFTSLYFSFGELGHLLTDDGPVFVWHLNELVGTVTATEFHNALDGMNSSLVDTLKAVNNLERAVNKSLASVLPLRTNLRVHEVWFRELRSALGNLRHEAEKLGKAVNVSVKSIEVSNTRLSVVKNNMHMMEKVFQYTLSMFHSTIEHELLSSLKKYQSAQSNFRTHLTTATQRLKISSSDKTLNAVSKLHLEEMAKHYEELFNRNSSDTDFFLKMFNWIRTKSAADLDEATGLFFGVVDDTASSLVSVILARERFADQCSGKFFPKLMGPFPEFQSKITTCLNQERSQISKITNTIGHVLLPVQLNSLGLSSGVGSCARLAESASREVDYMQATACLKANLREVSSYNQLMNAQLDSLRTVLPSATEESRARTKQCVMQTVIESSVLINDVKNGLLKCVVDGA